MNGPGLQGETPVIRAVSNRCGPALASHRKARKEEEDPDLKRNWVAGFSERGSWSCRGAVYRGSGGLGSISAAQAGAGNGQDLLTIVHCFSARLYRLRNYRKKLREALAQDV
jgi:hypothetical protein